MVCAGTRDEAQAPAAQLVTCFPPWLIILVFGFSPQRLPRSVGFLPPQALSPRKTGFLPGQVALTRPGTELARLEPRMRPWLTAPFRTPLHAFPLPSCLGPGLGKAPRWPGTLGTWEPSSPILGLCLDSRSPSTQDS